MNATTCVGVVLLISAACILGDYYLKRASQSSRPFATWEFSLGTLVFALSGAGWVVVLPHMKLGAVGIVYGVSTVLFMALLGWLAFEERLRWGELLGVALGLASMLLLARFAE